MNLEALSTRTRDVVRRQLDRSSRPFRIMRGRVEYRHRRQAARSLAASSGYDITELVNIGFMRFQPDPALVDQVVAMATQRLAEATVLPQRGNKPFFSQLLTPPDLRADTPFMRLALDERVLASVARYLGCAPFLQSVELLYSKPLLNRPMASQLWHRDRRDLKIIKVFLYASDVSMEHGPLTMLPLAESRRVPEYLQHYLTDEQIRRYISLDHAISLTGPAGSAFLVDSENCYHLGSRCLAPRLAYVAGYDSGFGFRDRERTWPESARPRAMSELQRFALGLV
jgi:hypothetical protein